MQFVIISIIIIAIIVYQSFCAINTIFNNLKKKITLLEIDRDEDRSTINYLEEKVSNLQVKYHDISNIKTNLETYILNNNKELQVLIESVDLINKSENLDDEILKNLIENINNINLKLEELEKNTESYNFNISHIKDSLKKAYEKIIEDGQ
ncbi:MAG: hypothetical protein PHT94_00840 [Candidatus Nanoarchaeia archaeon]|nr:hypothetical protein [Candidatus Nanoarchaeia archaeon]